MIWPQDGGSGKKKKMEDKDRKDSEKKVGTFKTNLRHCTLYLFSNICISISDLSISCSTCIVGGHETRVIARNHIYITTSTRKCRTVLGCDTQHRP